jgi:ADP-ribosylglycohydrolase
MTLATCEAIANSGRVDPALIADAFRSWFDERRFSGLGSSTLKALRDLQAGAHWALAGARGEMAAGNGGATITSCCRRTGRSRMASWCS